MLNKHTEFCNFLCFYRKTKKKKKKQDDEEAVSARLLPGVTFRGELCQKGFLSLTRLYCVIRDNMLICFKVVVTHRSDVNK